MKKYLLLLALFTVGCSASVNPGQYVEAVRLCKDNDGLQFIDMGQLRFDVYCKNKAIFEDISKSTFMQVKL